MRAWIELSVWRALLVASAATLGLGWLCVRPATRPVRPAAVASPIVLDAPARAPAKRP